MLTLAELQHQMRDLLLGESVLTSDMVASLEIKADDLAAKEHFFVNLNNVQSGLGGAISEFYPITQQLVGKEFFHNLTLQYLRKNAPTTACLSDYAYDFYAFIKTQPLFKKYPYVADIAHLEGLLRRSISLKHPVVPMSWEEIESQLNDPYDALAFSFDPGVSLMASKYNVANIFFYAKKMRDKKFPLEQQTFLTIYRSNARAIFQEIKGDTYQFIKALIQKKTLSEAIVAAEKASPSFEVQKILCQMCEWHMIKRVNIIQGA